MDLVSILRQFPNFAEVPPEQLQWFADHAEENHFPEQTTTSPAGAPIDYLTVLLEGRIRIDAGAADDIVVYDEPGSILGLLPYSRLKAASFPVVADANTMVLQLHRDHLRQMTEHCYELTAVMVWQMTDRVRDFTRQIQQGEKMASLGRLSAGLAHELNNPVSAVVRSADALKNHMKATPERFKAVMAIQLPDEEVDIVNELMFRRLSQLSPALSMLERNNRQDDLTDWLDDHDIQNPDDLTDSLVDFGFTVDDLDEIGDRVSDKNLGAVLNWIVNNLVTEKLVREIAEASSRISTLVGSIKSYTHMDRGEGKEVIELKHGIMNTLTLLDHKLRAKRISSSVQIPPDLPTLKGWPGELNQVWTNLIDNAVDAMPDGGRIEINAELDERPDGSAFVYTRVIDNGEGIPEAIRSKIFEPFFTTKAMGVGTGLGLDIVQGIMKHHRGSIKVESEPGRTEFIVCLPISE
jgi:signal transduction histidine kinase